jgi:predicted RNA binding protein YcfA (HicA-like mRNA interferase family)
MKDAKRRDVERYLKQQGYEPGRDDGRHTWWVKAGVRSVPLPRHSRISPGVLRGIEHIVGAVPAEWKQGKK